MTMADSPATPVSGLRTVLSSPGITMPTEGAVHASGGAIYMENFPALFRHDHARKILVGERRAVRADDRGGHAVGQSQAAAQGQAARKAQ